MGITKKFIREEVNSNMKINYLYDSFMNNINEIDPNLSYKDLATVISMILKNEYGEHNYEVFINDLKNKLGYE